MTKEQMKQYAKELEIFIGDKFEEKCEVKCGSYENAKYIEVVPAEGNQTGTFFWTTEIVDFCRGRNLTFWIAAKDSADGRLYSYAHIY